MEATISLSPARPARSKFVFRIVIAVLILLLLAFLAFDFWFYRAVRSAMPQVDGTVSLAGLSAPVIVTRDSLGVPTISAANTTDLFYAQGYVTAQDRLWQMDMTRRFASGDLSEILGEQYVKVDREQRILGLNQVADKVAADMPAEQRAQFEAYARGVNEYIEQHRKTLPLEFRFLVYFPHLWTVEDSVLVGLSMTEFLNHGLYKSALEKEKILAKLGPELTADLYVNSSWRDHPPGTQPGTLENGAPADVSPEEEDESGPKADRHIPRGRKPVGDNNPEMYGALLGRGPESRLYQTAGLRRAIPSRLQQLGGVGRAHGVGKATAVERYAPRPADSQHLV